jgi:translation initiation factor 3 subunit L
MSDPTAEDFLVNQQIKDFAFDLHDATRRSHLAEDIKRLYTVEFKELSEKYCDKQPWPVAEAIASQCIGNDGAPDAYFLCVYRELMFRHMFAKLKTTLEDRLAAWANYCALFDFVLAGDDAATELSSQWVFDILHEFVYQFQSFCQYRTQNSGRSAEERSLLEASDACWHAPTVLGYLLRLAALGRAADGPAGRARAPSPLHYQMGYFATISRSRVECLLGDYEASVAALAAVDPFDEGAEFAKIFSCRLNVLYHLGYSLMMLKRYRDALATFDGVLAHLARLAKHGGLQRFPAADQVQKMNDRMLALFAIALALAPGFPVDDGVAAAIKDKYGDKMALMERGDAATFDNMLTYASPKFVVPSIPDYGAPVNSSHDAYKQQIRLFNDEVLQQQKLSKIRSYLKLYTSIGLDKLARFNDESVAAFRAQLVGIKAKLRLDDRKPIGAARLDAAGGADDIHFYVKGDMIHVDEPATQAARHDDFFANQMKKYDDDIEVVKGLDAKPPPPPASPRAAQDRD